MSLRGGDPAAVGEEEEEETAEELLERVRGMVPAVAAAARAAGGFPGRWKAIAAKLDALPACLSDLSSHPCFARNALCRELLQSVAATLADAAELAARCREPPADGKLRTQSAIDALSGRLDLGLRDCALLVKTGVLSDAAGPSPSTPATESAAAAPSAAVQADVRELLARLQIGHAEATSRAVFQLLDDPADIARVAAVSRSWRRFVIENEFSKRLCRRICPEAATFTRAAVVTRSPPPAASASSHDPECRAREGEHAAFSYLAAALASTKPTVEQIMHCVGASSTDNFPDETIQHTLVPQERVYHRHSYWSSGGHHDPDVPESLTYRLASDLCLIDEIRVRPYRASFQLGHPIYSSKAVRIRLGHSKLHPGPEFVSSENENLAAVADENYTWTYTSPEFPMLQENVLQSFKLPRPALCIGGVVKIELLGRIQKQSTDDKYYICVCHVQVRGRSLSPDLMIDISNPADYSNLKYLPGASNFRREDLLSSDGKDSSDWRSLVSRYREMRQLSMVYMLLGPVQFMDEDEVEAEPDLLHMM